MRYDAVIIGGGRSGCAEAQSRVAEGQKVCVVSAGLTLHSLEPELKDKPYALLHELVKAGVAVLRGDIAESVEWSAGGSASPAVSAIRTANGVTLEAAEFVLATGRFFSRGLVADMEGVREPLFGAE